MAVAWSLLMLARNSDMFGVAGLIWNDFLSRSRRMIVILLYLFLFFFSSRRRHTRCSRDWSSDVCSSDLWFRYGTPVEFKRPDGTEGRSRWLCVCEACLAEFPEPQKAIWRDMVWAEDSRSEERRVGEECRSRWSADH